MQTRQWGIQGLEDNSAKDATPRQERTPHRRLRGDGGVPKKEQDQGHVCNGKSTNKASMPLGQIGKKVNLA